MSMRDIPNRRPRAWWFIFDNLIWPKLIAAIWMGMFLAVGIVTAVVKIIEVI